MEIKFLYRIRVYERYVYTLTWYDPSGINISPFPTALSGSQRRRSNSSFPPDEVRRAQDHVLEPTIPPSELIKAIGHLPQFPIALTFIGTSAL